MCEKHSQISSARSEFESSILAGIAILVGPSGVEKLVLQAESPEVLRASQRIAEKCSDELWNIDRKVRVED
jgi:hypothetical protein